MIKNGQYYLVTTTDWFIAPDGHQYRAAWGKCHTHTTDEVFSFTPTRQHTNWFIEVGTGENSIIIAGCRVMYAVQQEKRPTKRTEQYRDSTEVLHSVNKIYFTEV